MVKYKNGGILKNYNSSTGIAYEFANDDSTFYFVLQTRMPRAIYKIINGGITITMKLSDEHKQNNGLSLTYPIFKSGNLPMVDLEAKPKSSKDTTNYTIQIDSFRRKLNDQLLIHSKNIILKGVAHLQDTLFSVYNDNGIRAEQQFDKRFFYNIELSIPIKFLKETRKGLTNIYLNVQVNGFPLAKNVTLLVVNDASREALYPTYFSRIYKVAK